MYAWRLQGVTQRCLLFQEERPQLGHFIFSWHLFFNVTSHGRNILFSEHRLFREGGNIHANCPGICFLLRIDFSWNYGMVSFKSLSQHWPVFFLFPIIYQDRLVKKEHRGWLELIIMTWLRRRGRNLDWQQNNKADLSNVTMQKTIFKCSAVSSTWQFFIHALLGNEEDLNRLLIV